MSISWRARGPVADVLAVAGLVAVAGLIEYFLRHLLSRPFYYDEASRASEIALGAGFFKLLHTAAAPLALGWFGIETAARMLLGDTEAGLRAPMFLAFPVLGVATFRLARHWLGTGTSFAVAGLLLLNSWIVNYALQLKSYSYEGIFAVAAVGIYLSIRRPGRPAARLLALYGLLGLTCVFSLPNLFVAGPLLALDLVAVLRLRRRVALRIAGEAIAVAIAAAHYLLFVRPQSGVASTRFFIFYYPPHGLTPLTHFAGAGLRSYVPTMVTGVASAVSTPPSYTLPPTMAMLLSVVLLVALAAGVVAAARNAGGRTLVVAVSAALLLELLASTIQRWPFGLLRVNIFVLPLLYVLGGIGVTWLTRVLRGRRRTAGGRYVPVSWWRAISLGAAMLALATAATAGATSTAAALSETSQSQTLPTWFGDTRAAVAESRLLTASGDLVIIRADRLPADWYAGPWLYYMNAYQGYPASINALPRIPASNTISVAQVTPPAVAGFLSGHASSRLIFLLEYELPGGHFPWWAHRQSLMTLRQYGYCRAAEIPLPDTGALTIVGRGGCPRTEAQEATIRHARLTRANA